MAMDEELGGTEFCMYLSLLEELFTAEPTTASSEMEESLWIHLPGELVERVLLYLPLSSQARFRSVCRRWRQLLQSAKFQETTALIAITSGDCVCMCRLRQPCQLENRHFKVHKVDLSMIPPECREDLEISSHGGLVGLAWYADNLRELWCWVLNPVNNTWRELPRLPIRKDPKSAVTSLVSFTQQGGCSFKVFVDTRYDGLLATFHFYSSTTNDWTISAFGKIGELLEDGEPGAGLPEVGTCVVSRAGHVYATSMFSWRRNPLTKFVCLSSEGKFLGMPPEFAGAASILMASSEREGLWSTTIRGLHIAKWDEGSSEWEVLPSNKMPKEILGWDGIAKNESSANNMLCEDHCVLYNARIVRDILLSLAEDSCSPGSHVLAYHMTEATWKYVGELQEEEGEVGLTFLAPRPQLQISS